MGQHERTKLTLLGAGFGAGAGCIALFVTWLFLPRESDVVPARVHPPEIAPAATAASPVVAETSSATPFTPPPRSENQAEIHDKLKRIGLALHGHQDVYRLFAPPMAVTRDDKATQLSWRVHILPYLGHKPLYEEFYLDEPWDSPHNKKLLDKMPDAFRIATAPEPVTRFRVFTGPRVIFGPGNKVSIRNISDGLPNTLLTVVVGPDRAVPWTMPDELPLDESNPIAALGTLPDPVFDCLTADGLALALPANIAPQQFVALATPAGGEVVDGGSLRHGIGVRTVTAAASTPNAGRTAPEPVVAARPSNVAQPAGDHKLSLVPPTEAPKLRETLYKLNRIGLAMVHYAEKNGGRLPTVGDPDTFPHRDRPNLSWRVRLLPFLDQSPLYEAFRMNEPWDSPHNLALLDRMPDIYRSVPSDGSATRMQVIQGEKMLFGQAPQTLQRVRRGLVLVVQTGWDRAVPWTKPQDIEFDPAAPLAGLGTIGSDPILCAAGLNETFVLPPDIDAATFTALVVPEHRQIVDFRRFVRAWHEVPTISTPESEAALKRNRQWNKIIEIQHALREFHDSNHRFPPTEDRNQRDTEGRPLLSWRVQILPYLDHILLYSKFKLNEPWDSPHNRPLLDLMPDVFRDDEDSTTSTSTRFMVVTGPGTPFSGGPGPRLRDFRNGGSTTVLVLRAGKDKAVPWTKPDDVVFNPAAPLDALGSLGGEEFLFGTVNGAVYRVQPTLPAAVFRALATVRGGAVLNMSALEKSDFAAALASSSKQSTSVETTKPPR